MSSSDASRLDTLLGPRVPQAVKSAVSTWLTLLKEWNARIDLTAARDDNELYDLMLADALALAKRLPASSRVVDVGSGAGAPGLALALARPDLKVTLVEPLTKRIAFLRTVVGTVNRADIELVRDRGEGVAEKRPNDWDVAISRATLPPASWIPLGLKLAPEAWALVAKADPPEIPGAAAREQVKYVWPLTKAARRVIRYTRA